MNFIWQGKDPLNRRVEATLYYDFPRQRLQLEYTRRELASRQRGTSATCQRWLSSSLTWASLMINRSPTYDRGVLLSRDP